jgi:hypothetical protein
MRRKRTKAQYACMQILDESDDDCARGTGDHISSRMDGINCITKKSSSTKKMQITLLEDGLSTYAPLLMYRYSCHGSF